MTVITRFAPSPTGMLHIGGARTALFNWCYTKAKGGQFLLRIEDTDQERSTEAAKQAILRDLAWLGISWDGEPTYQLARAPRHTEVAMELLAKGQAYYCYCTPAELDAMREDALKRGEQPRYNRMWRDRDPKTAPEGVKPSIRIKAPLDGESVIIDAVQGEVRIANSQLDDMIIMRGDGTPTYNHAVVVDDHDMGITHVIRGDDHLNNAFRQKMIFEAMGWPVPVFAHIPLIHGEDGAKLSKRNGATGAEDYKNMGYLPEALCNYLLRLGWSHGDDEIFTKEQAAQWFDLAGINAGPSRLDIKKLDHINAHYIREADDARLLDLMLAAQNTIITTEQRGWILAGLHDLKPRASTLVQLWAGCAPYLKNVPFEYDAQASTALNDHDAHHAAHALYDALSSLKDFNDVMIEQACRAAAASHFGGKLAKVAVPLRAALTGTTVSPPIFKMAEIFGQRETLNRLKAALHWMHDNGHAHHH